METPPFALAVRALRGLLWFSLAMLALLACLGVVFRWDRLPSLQEFPWRVSLTFVGLAFGAWLATIQLRGRAQYPTTAAVSLAGIVFSQGCYLVLVWTNFSMRPWLWRCWWLSMVTAAVATHVLWLRIAVAPDRRRLRRATIACALVGGALWAGLALRRSITEMPSAAYLVAVLSFAMLTTLGTVVLWWRGSRSSPSGGVLRSAKIAGLLAAQAAVLLAAFYLGRITAPAPSLFEQLPSAIAAMSPRELEAQVRADLDRLRVVAAGLDRWEEQAAALAVGLRERRLAEKREVFTPDEDDQLRAQYLTFLAYRAALLRMAAHYAGFNAIRDPAARARCLLLGYAADGLFYVSSLRLVQLFEDDPAARRKLNEAEPAWGVPPEMFDQIVAGISHPHHAQMLAEIAAFYEAHREEWLSAEVLPKEDLAFLVARIDRSAPLIRARAPDGAEERFQRLLARMKRDVRGPVYATQSLVSTWIGDTRLVQWEPLIGRDQIDEIERQLAPGDILLERRNWYLSNAFLPGFWPHGALYVGRPEDLEKLGLLHRRGGAWSSDHPTLRKHLAAYLRSAPDGQAHDVIESVSEGVILNSLHESMRADHVAALRPRLSDAQKAEAIVRAFEHVGKPYDFEFDFFTSDKLVCTELVYRAYEGLIHFELVKVAGRATLPALDIAKKFAAERNTPRQELDFVLFLDSVPGQRRARRAGEDEFCETIHRPQAFQE